MSRHLEVLKLVLSELGISPNEADTLAGRKLIQKSIYLSQRGGIDLGYRYGWYIHGPYSPALARDYFAIRDTEIGGAALELSRSVSDLLGEVRPLLTPRHDTGLPQYAWVELLASIDFQVKVAKKDRQEARSVIEREKDHLASKFDVAWSALEEAGFVHAA